MTKAMELVVRIKPLSRLRLHGAGDRSARTPGPGAIPGEEPLLPRIETLLGLLASTSWRLEGAEWSCTSWDDCVMEKAEKLLCNDGLKYIVGPFLVTRTISGEIRVYLNASTVLLELSGLRDYLYAAELLREAATAYTPGEKKRLRRQAGEVLQGLAEQGKLVADNAIAQRLTGIALSHTTRTTIHGLIYSQAHVDYTVLGKDTEIILVAKCVAEPKTLDEIPVDLRPRSAPVILQVDTANLPCIAAATPAIVLSPSPISLDGIGSLVAVHPLPPRPPLEQLAKAYKPEPWKHEKTQPIPALWPGTIILKGLVQAAQRIMHVASIDSLAVFYKELKTLVTRIS